MLTFVAAGADTIEFATGGQIGHVARYAAPALLVMAMIWALSGVSGAHFNPAVTLGFVLHGSFDVRRAPGYVLAQLAGGTAGAAVLLLLLGRAMEHGVTKPGPGFTALQAFGAEGLLTFLLVYTIVGTSEQKAVVGKNAALAVGGVIALCGFGFSPMSGASMNPARSLGPMFVSGELHDAWIYIAGPCCGALSAVLMVLLTHGRPGDEEKSTAQGRQ